MVIKNIMKTYLYMHCGTYPSDITSQVCIYFLRNTPGAVPVPISQSDANNTLPKHFDFGVLNSHPLYMLNQMLTKVYTPLLSYSGQESDEILSKKQEALESESNKLEDKVENEKAARVSVLFCFEGMIVTRSLIGVP